MARATDPGWLSMEAEATAPLLQGQTGGRLQVESQFKSDIRELSGAATNAAPNSFEQGWGPRTTAPPQPPLMGVGEALVRYSDAMLDEVAVVQALQRGDLARAVVLLLHDNQNLRHELEASRADFNELRSVNVAIQEQMNEALGVADDQRVQLMEELDRARDGIDALECQAEQARTNYEVELTELRQQLDAADYKLFDLGAKLADSQSRLTTRGT